MSVNTFFVKQVNKFSKLKVDCFCIWFFLNWCLTSQKSLCVRILSMSVYDEFSHLKSGKTWKWDVCQLMLILPHGCRFPAGVRGQGSSRSKYQNCQILIFKIFATLNIGTTPSFDFVHYLLNLLNMNKNEGRNYNLLLIKISFLNVSHYIIKTYETCVKF